MTEKTIGPTVPLVRGLSEQLIFMRNLFKRKKAKCLGNFMHTSPKSIPSKHFKQKTCCLVNQSNQISALVCGDWASWWLSGKESACHRRRLGFNLWVGKIPWRRKWQPSSVILPGKSHGQRNLAGYSPRGCKESDTTEQLNN